MSAVRFVRGGVDAEAVGALWAALTGRRTGPLLLTTDREEFAGSSRRITQALDDIDVVLRTSGSTDGRGHLVGLSLAALAASADATLARLGGPGQWVTSLPTTAVAGFQVVLRSVRAGIEPVVHEAGKPLDAGLRRGVPHYLSLVPTQLVRALASDPAPLRAFDAVLVGGAALDPATAERAASTGLRIVTTYGMTETAGGCVYDGVPLDGVRVRTPGDRIGLAGPILATRYLDTERQPFETDADGVRWLVTNDRGTWANGRLEVHGRLDDVLITGGVNVNPGEVAARLQSLLGVPLVVVGFPDPEWGDRLVAISQTPVEEAAFRAACRTLERAQRPKQLLVHPDAWPSTFSGKVDLLRLRAWAGERLNPT
ncbi:AMP-binding protein [Propioniciclava sp.]|uniref:AMP-binding protein n=1 Tax=Propioniciclava sp. TaxID=2038686 RepID=UPI00260DDEF0|nr:AMP-binding protein [Propioniciclava sp.]